MPKVNGALYYPSGFRSVNFSGSVSQPQEADLELVSLFNRYMTNPTAFHSWNHRKELIEVAVRLLGDVSDWLVFQQDNPMICDNAYEFLEDTIAFIKTGKRPFSIYGRTSMFRTERVARYSDMDVKLLSRKRLQPLEAQLPKNEKSLLSLWLSRTGGFEDLICSLYAWFGPNEPVKAL